MSYKNDHFIKIDDPVVRDLMKTDIVPMFRDLDDNEEQEFRQWSRENYEPGSKIEAFWHPVVQDECHKINQERREDEKRENDGGR